MNDEGSNEGGDRYRTSGEHEHMSTPELDPAEFPYFQTYTLMVRGHCADLPERLADMRDDSAPIDTYAYDFRKRRWLTMSELWRTDPTAASEIERRVAPQYRIEGLGQVPTMLDKLDAVGENVTSIRRSASYTPPTYSIAITRYELGLRSVFSHGEPDEMDKRELAAVVRDLRAILHGLEEKL